MMPPKPPLSGGPFDFVGTDKKVSGNFPGLADLVDHVEREGTPP